MLHYELGYKCSPRRIQNVANEIKRRRSLGRQKLLKYEKNTLNILITLRKLMPLSSSAYLKEIQIWEILNQL